MVKTMRMVEMSPLMTTYTGDGDGEVKVLDHTKTDNTLKVLQQPIGELKPQGNPASPQEGEHCGYLLYKSWAQMGAWKKKWFVLKDNFLFQYEKNTSKSPKKSFPIGYCLTEAMAAEAMAEEANARYMMKLEEKACSKRLNVYTADKVFVFSSTSEDEATAWAEAIDRSLRAAALRACPGATDADKEKAADALIAKKKEAAEIMMPLMMAQSIQEIDAADVLIKNLQSVGLMSAEADDPRHSDNIAKAGKMKMLKSSLDENVWQKFYFVLVDQTMYYYKSRHHSKKANYDDKDDKDDDDDDEEEDENDMPWKGAFAVKLATVNAAPPAISTKAKVFQIKTPLRTFILKARHEVDAEEWMSHICASQQGIPVDARESKLRGFDVYDDKLAEKLLALKDKKKKDSVTLTLVDVLKHPVGVRYYSQYLETIDNKLAKTVKVFKSIEKYKTKVVPTKKYKKALKIFKKYVKGSAHVPKEMQNELASQVENFDFAAQNMFTLLEDHLYKVYESHMSPFQASEVFTTLVESTGPKKIIVSGGKDSAERPYKLEGTVFVGRSRDNDSGDGYIQLEDDHKVSREHCKIDAGPLGVLVTDLGSSKGTRLDAKDGKKVMAKIILPGQSLFIGGYVLTYQLGEAPKASPKKKGGGMFSMFSKKK